MGVALKLNKSAEIHRRSLAAGYPPTPSWAKLSDIKCLPVKISSGERLTREGKKINIDIKFIMLNTDITETDRIKYNSQYYDIYSIKDPNHKGRHLEVETYRKEGIS